MPFWTLSMIESIQPNFEFYWRFARSTDGDSFYVDSEVIRIYYFNHQIIISKEAFIKTTQL